MSLTAEGYRERKWGSFPALRQALEDKRVPSGYYGLTSASDNMFDTMSRLVEIAVLTTEFQSEIRQTAVSTGQQQMHRDLRQLEAALEEVSQFFQSTIGKVRVLYETL